MAADIKTRHKDNHSINLISTNTCLCSKAAHNLCSAFFWGGGEFIPCCGQSPSPPPLSISCFTICSSSFCLNKIQRPGNLLFYQSNLHHSSVLFSNALSLQMMNKHQLHLHRKYSHLMVVLLARKLSSAQERQTGLEKKFSCMGIQPGM